MSVRREIILNTFQGLCFTEFGTGIDNITKVKADASERKIYRLASGGKTLIGIYNENPEENSAFINFSGSFKRSGFNVPEIYAVSEDKLFYLEEDLGNTTLFKSLNGSDPDKAMDLYRRSLSDLVNFQLKGKDIIDFSYCYQTSEFDRSVIESDLFKFNEYYSYFFRNEKFDERVIQSIIKNSEILLSEVNCGYFLYRDFQPRNIMVRDDELFYIDYQSGRKGPLHYDLASFLYSGSIKITEEERIKLIEHYLNEIGSEVEIDKEKFITEFYLFVFLRLLQMLGSYAYLHKIRNDDGFLKKIYGALFNLKSIRNKIGNPEFKIIIDSLTVSLN